MNTINKISRTLAAVLCAVCVLSACTSSLNDEIGVAKAQQFDKIQVGDYPTFESVTADAATRSNIGAPDAGKSAWETGDEILIRLTDADQVVSTGTMVCTVTDGKVSWSVKEASFSVKEGSAMLDAYYAPAYEWKEGALSLKEGRSAGSGDYLTSTRQQVQVPNNVVVKFNTSRTFSRLRVATDSGTQITLAASTFVPVGTDTALGESTISSTADVNGNAYFYGTWTEGTATLSCNACKDIRKVVLPAPTVMKSYAVMFPRTVDVTATYCDYIYSYELKKDWSSNDTFIMYNNRLKAGTWFTRSPANNTFTGVVPLGDGTYYAVYGSNFTNDNKAEGIDSPERYEYGKIYIDLKGQSGDFEVVEGAASLQVAKTKDLNSGLTFANKLTLFVFYYFKIAGTVKKISIGGLHNHATYDMESDTYSYDDSHLLPIEVTNSGKGFIPNNEYGDRLVIAQMAVFPESADLLFFKVETDTDLYGIFCQSTIPLPTGEAYTYQEDLSNRKVKHEFVDLGLPSGTLWATMNVGAIDDRDVGDYYAWGETETKDTYSAATYQLPGSDVKSIAGTEHDVAHVKWRGKWQMPTKQQMQELLDNTTQDKYYYTFNGNQHFIGYKLVSKKDPNKYIILPVSGYRQNDILQKSSDYCYRTADESSVENRSLGYLVRPVLIPEKSNSGTTDYGSSSDSDFNN